MRTKKDKRHTATCGHKIDEGIHVSIKDHNKYGMNCINYGTYCVDCVVKYYEEGRIFNTEMTELIERLLNGNKK